MGQRDGAFYQHVHLHNNEGKKDTHGSLKAASIPAEQLLECLMKDPTEKTYTIECNSAKAVSNLGNCTAMYLTENKKIYIMDRNDKDGGNYEK